METNQLDRYTYAKEIYGEATIDEFLAVFNPMNKTVCVWGRGI